MEFFEGDCGDAERGHMPFLSGEEHATIVIKPDLDADVLVPHVTAFPSLESAVWLSSPELFDVFRASHNQRTSR